MNKSKQEMILEVLSKKSDITLDELTEELVENHRYVERLEVLAALRPLQSANKVSMSDDGRISLAGACISASIR